MDTQIDAYIFLINLWKSRTKDKILKHLISMIMKY